MPGPTVLWRLVFAVVGTGGYGLLYRPGWSNLFLLLYDVPTLLLSFSFAGNVLRNLFVSRSAGHGALLGVLLLALVCGYGAQYRSWPLSGHLTVALTVGIIEAGNRQNPPSLKGAALLPAALLVLIRTFWPQSEWMGNRLNTVVALLVGGLLGGGAILNRFQDGEGPGK